MNLFAEKVEFALSFVLHEKTHVLNGTFNGNTTEKKQTNKNAS